MDMETIFSELLNPIRDLNKNWEIDIATYLEKYLEQLEGLNIAFCEGPAKLNFAQAAFLIQRTTDVYSKKVEYLYNLVYQMLQLLCSKKNSADAQSNDQRKDNSVNNSNSSHEPLLPLDDITTQRNLQLVEDFHTSSSRKCTFKLLPPIFVSLIQVEEVEKEDFMLVGHKGEFSGYKKDFLANICNLHKTGSLLLHLRDFKELDITTAEIPHVYESGNLDEYDTNDADDFLDNYGSPPEDPLEFQLNEPEQQEKNSLNKTIQENQSEPPLEPSLPSSLAWKVLDPYVETKTKQIPMRKSRTTRLFKKEHQTKQITKRKQNSKSANSNIQPASEFCSKLCYPIDCKISSNELKVPEILGLDTAWFKEIKKRKENFKKLKLKEKESLIKNNADNGQADGITPDLAICNDDSGEFPLDADDISSSPEPDCNACVLNSPQITAVDKGDMSCITTYDDEVSKHIDKYLANVAEYRKTTDISKRVSEWEEKILPSLEQEEKRETYDIHIYSTRILDHFSDNNRKQTLAFTQVCNGKETWEISRYFLASLQLANNYNVEISTDGFLEEGLDTMKLTLLSRKRHHEDLRNFKVS